MNLPWSETQWQKDLSQAISDPQELLSLLGLEPGVVGESLLAAKEFKLRVPRSFVARMRKNDVHDPLLMQVLPIEKELISPVDYLADPLHEQSKNILPGLLHKYSTRVLLLVAGACAVHCRYCFRREFDYSGNNAGREGWAKIFNYIRNKPLVNEVILSGGDPLILNDDYLSGFVKDIADILHIKRLRIHTRFPIVLPQRVTQGLLRALQTRLKTVVVIHSNHPNEIDDEVGVAMQAMRDSGITLLNQSVLLEGINDSAIILQALSEKLFSIGVLPYYLHLLDKVKGAAHFSVSRKRAVKIAQKLCAVLPGYLVPKLVEEEPGKQSKMLVNL